MNASTIDTTDTFDPQGAVGTMHADDIVAVIKESFPESAHILVDTLEAAGFEAYFVGGCIRDAILGKTPQDIDVTTSARWEDVEEVIQATGWKTFRTGVKHGTLTVIDPGTDAKYEVTTYRVDGAYADGRHPDNVSFTTCLEEDLARRDFTMNAIAYNEHRGIVDPFGGIEDISAGIIKAVGNPKKRFSEDGLRILRACRFASQLGFQIEEDTFCAMVACKSNLRKVSIERITYELDRLLLGTYVFHALMRTCDVLSFVLPELVAMKDCEQRTPYHIYDVFEHTAHVVEHVPPTRLMRWTALCHDMGKPAAAFFDGEGIEHFYGHAHISTQIARGMLSRLLMSPSFIDDVITLVRVHDDVIEPEKRPVRRMLNRLNGNTEMFRNLCALKRADAASQAPLCAPRIAMADELESTLDQILADDDAFCIKDLAINGNDLIALGFTQGPNIGEVLKMMLDAVIDGDVPNDRAALIELAKSSL